MKREKKEETMISVFIRMPEEIYIRGKVFLAKTKKYKTWQSLLTDALIEKLDRDEERK